MSKSKLTLLIDGNWLLMSRLSVLNNKYLDDFDLCHNLQLLMIKSINVVLRNFRDIDNIIFCSDGGSWRNQIPLPNCLKKDKDGNPIEYKGTRVKSTDINWQAIFDSYHELMDIMQRNNITVSNDKDIEGDDWIWWWSTYLNSKGTNCIIWTKDNDLKQLVHMNENKCFSVWWNKDGGLFTEDFPEDSFNFMFNYEFNENEKLLTDICKKSVSVTKINPKHIVIDKILKGDVSDNILPVILRVSKTNPDKKFKISTKDIDYDLEYDNDNNVNEYITETLSMKKYLGKVEDSVTDTIDHFKYNRKLVELSKGNYPKEIYEKLSKNTEYNISNDLSNVESEIQAITNKMQGLLEII